MVENKHRSCLVYHTFVGICISVGHRIVRGGCILDFLKVMVWAGYREHHTGVASQDDPAHHRDRRLFLLKLRAWGSYLLLISHPRSNFDERWNKGQPNEQS